MAPVSAGLLLWRRAGGGVEFFLVHPGGPFWARKDRAAWSIPKGLADTGEDLLAAAKREFAEETGQAVDGDFRPLGEFRASGKTIVAWLVEADCDPKAIRSNEFEMEWPPRSGRMQRFPEVDRAGWFAPAVALDKVHKGQRALIVAALRALGVE